MRVEVDVAAMQALVKDLAIDPVVTNERMIKANAIAEDARTLAAAEAYETGAYERGIRAERLTTGQQVAKSAPVNVPVIQVGAHDFKSHWIEYGYTHEGGEFVPPRAILRRAAEASE